MNNSATLQGHLFFKLTLLAGMLFLSANTYAQSFMNFSSYNTKLALGVEDNRYIFAGYRSANNFDINLRNTTYGEKLSTQLVQLDLGYNLKVSDNFHISPRVYAFSNYAFDRRSVWGNIDFELKADDFKFAYGVYGYKKEDADKFKIANRFSVYYQAADDVAIYSMYGPSVNFLSFKDELNTGVVLRGGKLAGRVGYYIPDSFNFKYSGINLSLLYNIL